MINLIRKVILLLCIIILLNACGSNTTETSNSGFYKKERSDSAALFYDPSKADRRIEEIIRDLNQNSGFNGNVLIAKNGEIIYEKAIGWADHLHRDSLKINSVFELASLSKPFTATAIMMLVKEGKLMLNQNVKDFYPNFPYDNISVELLLTHKSGMMNYVYFLDNLWKKQKKDERIGVTNQEVMDLIAEHKPNPYSKPNVKFHYNNSNFMVLAAIIEKISGQKYSQFMAENIFKPLGMKNTAVYSKAEYDKIPVNVIGHDRTFRRSVAQNFLDGPVGDKGIYSTIHDLYLFDRALRAGKLLDSEALNSMYDPYNVMQRGHFNYGYGWRTFQNDSNKVVYHTGWWHGFKHIFLRQLDKDITIILLTNLSNGGLLKLDELYTHVGMPTVRKGAYSSKGELSVADDED